MALPNGDSKIVDSKEIEISSASDGESYGTEQKGSTRQDAQDMSRMGKRQELRVSNSITSMVIRF